LLFANSAIALAPPGNAQPIERKMPHDFAFDLGEPDLDLVKPATS
jgi:hypothetical protein